MKRVLPILVVVLLLSAALSAQVTYTSKMTTGPFLIASNAVSLDWALVNNDTANVDVRVTIYKLDLLGAKVALPPGPITVNLAPNMTTHNANSVAAFYTPGFYYEVVVESTSDKVFPCVNQWSSMAADGYIVGTLIPSASFINIKMPKPPKP